MNRSDLQRLARTRINEAKVLLENGRYEGAYYLAGYAVECALKACIAKQTQRQEFPDKKRVDDSYTHDLAKLARVANLENDLKKETQLNSAFDSYWSFVVGWSEAARYQFVTPESATNLYNAITDRQHGVLSWLKKYW